MEINKHDLEKEKNRLRNIEYRRRNGVRPMSERVMPRKNPVDRFLAKVDVVTESGCWIWMGSLQRNGHGQMFIDGGLSGAHRASWILFVGPIPEGLCVCHKCDVYSCVNPSHLFLGTQKDNMDDMARKGRSAKGENSHVSKLTERDIISIRNDTRTCRVIGADYGISCGHVSLIKTRKSWRHIHDSPEHET